MVTTHSQFSRQVLPYIKPLAGADGYTLAGRALPSSAISVPANPLCIPTGGSERLALSG